MSLFLYIGTVFHIVWSWHLAEHCGRSGRCGGFFFFSDWGFFFLTAMVFGGFILLVVYLLNLWFHGVGGGDNMLPLEQL